MQRGSAAYNSEPLQSLDELTATTYNLNLYMHQVHVTDEGLRASACYSNQPGDQQ